MLSDAFTTTDHTAAGPLVEGEAGAVVRKHTGLEPALCSAPGGLTESEESSTTRRTPADTAASTSSSMPAGSA